jgi:hypothetical protein
MADTFRMVTLMDSGRPVPVLDLNSELGGISRQRDTFAVTPPENRVRVAQGSEPYVGDRVYPGGHGNAAVTTTFTVKGSTPAAAAARLEELLALAARDLAGRELLLEWRAEGLARSAYFPVRGPATAAPTYRARAFAGSSKPLLEVNVTWPVAPLAEGAPMSVDDTFAAPPDKPGGIVNLLADPTFEDTAGSIPRWQSYSAGTGPPTFSTFGATPTGAGFTGASGGQILVATTNAAMGAASAIGAATAESIPVTPGKLMAAAVAINIVSGGNAQTFPNIYLEWRNAENNAVIPANEVNGVGGNGITRPGLVVTVPPGAVFVRVFIRVVQGAAPSAAAVTARFDSVLFTEVPAGTTVVPDYLDGDSPTGRWEDVAGNSRSVELVEDKLGEWTIDQGPSNLKVRQDNRIVEPGGGLMTAVPTPALPWRTRMRHTGRGNKVYDPAIVCTFVAPIAAQVNATNKFRVSVGKAIDATTMIYVRFEWDGIAVPTLAIITETAAGTVSIVSGPTPAITGGKVYTLAFMLCGSEVRAPLFDTAGGYDLNSAGAISSQVVNGGQADPYIGPGDPYLAIENMPVSGRVRRFRVIPYAFPAINGPAVYPVRGIPGNAPARADVEVHAAGTPGPVFGLLAWWRSPRVYNIAPLGELDPVAATDFWFSGTLSGNNITNGGSASRQTDGPLGHAYARITAGATTNTGSVMRLMHRLIRGRYYTLEYWVRPNTGTWEFRQSFGGSFGASEAMPAAGSGWTRIRKTFLQGVDATQIELIWRKVGATAGGETLDVAALRFFEGSVAPVDADQAEGRGGSPPLGLFLPGADRPGARSASLVETSGFTNQSPNARALVLGTTSTSGTGAGGNQGVAEWIIDPDLYVEGDETDDTLPLEVWGHGLVGASNNGTRVAMSVKPWPLLGGASLYTSEYGAAGKLLSPPGAGLGPVSAWRLGTLVIPRVAGGFGRAVLRMDVTVVNTTGGLFHLYYLFLVPARRRASSPSGKVYDSTYPPFLNAQGLQTVKRVRSDLRGRLERNDGVSGGWDQGLGGSSIFPNPGDNQFATWLLQPGTSAPSTGVPDDPSTTIVSSGGPVYSTLYGVGLHVTPRYRLWRPE